MKLSPRTIHAVKGEVVWQRVFQGDYRHLVIRAPAIARTAQPGQFVMIRIHDNTEPLLPRPFSIFRARHQGGDTIEVLYKVVGFGSAQLAVKRPGERLDVTGPLGRPFTLRRRDSPQWLVGGGYGVGPMVFMAERLKPWRSSVLAFVGARHKEAVLCVRDFKKAGVPVLISTDDGSLGEKGQVTDLIKRELQKTAGRPCLYACGPLPMLKAVAELAMRYRLPCEVSLEETMGCGTGVCLSCVCDVRGDDGQTVQRMICRHGPVFKGEEVLWDRLRRHGP